MKSINKLASATALALAMGFGMAGNASAAFISCVNGAEDAGADYDISTKVTPNTGCTILSPLNGAVNDKVSPPENTYTVNVEKFFNFDDWKFNGKLVEGDSSTLFNFSGGTQSGTITPVGNFSDIGNVMLVFKDGGDTNLVGYLVSGLGGVISYSSPFVEPPFTFPGTGPRDISHISVYYRGTPDLPPEETPEPGVLLLMGAGLLGLGMARRRKSA